MPILIECKNEYEFSWNNLCDPKQKSSQSLVPDIGLITNHGSSVKSNHSQTSERNDSPLAVGLSNSHSIEIHPLLMRSPSFLSITEGLPVAVALVLVGRLTSTLTIDDWKNVIHQVLLPIYAAGIAGYLVLRIYHVVLEPLLLEAILPSHKKKKRGGDGVLVGPPTLQEEEEGGFDEAKEALAPQPIDMTGIYKLVENDNFEELLAAQGIPWALRSAANRARPTHKFTHRGNLLTIKIQGIIESETKYHIGGRATETAVRGRQFHDTVTYLEDKTGIQTLKRAINDGYTVKVCRRLSPDKSKLTMTSTVDFDDESKDSVECRQIFERIDSE